jgi:hypothetical protein
MAKKVEDSMNDQIHALIRKCLREHRAEVIEKWEKNLEIDEKFLLFQMTDDLGLTLNKYLDEVLALLVPTYATIPPLSHNPLPWDAVRREIAVLLTGRKVLVHFLKEHLNVSEEEWLHVRDDFNRVFQQVLRKNSASACDCCRWAMDNQMAVFTKIETDLYKTIH